MTLLLALRIATATVYLLGHLVMLWHQLGFR